MNPPKFSSSVLSYFSPSFDWLPSCKNSGSIDEDLFLHGKLLLENEIVLNPNRKEDLLEKGDLQRVPVIEEHFWGYRCRRCGNQQKRLFAEWPCSCSATCVYCRKCIEMGRISSCSRFLVWTGSWREWKRYNKPLEWEGELTSFQLRASAEVTKAIRETTDLLVWAVCGSGKTEMLFEGIAEALCSGKRTCIATPRSDVVRELYPRLQKVFRGVDVAALYGGSEQKDEGAQLVLATTHQLLRYARAFDVLIIDEVDAFPFYADRSLMWAAKRSKKEVATTTPRLKYKMLSWFKKLPTVFVPQRFHGHPLPVPRFVSCFGWKSSLEKNTLPRKIKNWMESKDRRRVLIFAPTIDLAEKLSELVPGSVYVHSQNVDRSLKIQQFRDHKIPILITTAILERGVTFPSIDVAVFHAGHRNFDEAALVQIAGRAGRSAEDPSGDVVFFHDGKSEGMVSARYSILSMNDRAKKWRG